MIDKTRIAKLIPYILLSLSVVLNLFFIIYFIFNKDLILSKNSKTITPLSSSLTSAKNSTFEIGKIYLVDICPGTEICNYLYLRRNNDNGVLARASGEGMVKTANDLEQNTWENISRIDIPGNFNGFGSSIDAWGYYYLVAIEKLGDSGNTKSVLLKINESNNQTIKLEDDLLSLFQGSEINDNNYVSYELKAMTNKYLAVSLRGSSMEPLILIVNTENGKSEYLGLVSISYKYGDSDFKYKGLTPVKIPCIGEEVGSCDGEITTYQPVGSYKTVKFP